MIPHLKMLEAEGLGAGFEPGFKKQKQELEEGMGRGGRGCGW